MCGIVGIYLKNSKYELSLGSFLADMLNSMEGRGPDSAGFAIYSKEIKNHYKYSMCLNKLSENDFELRVKEYFDNHKIHKHSDHVVLETTEEPEKALIILEEHFAEFSIVGYGKSINIFKQTGNPKDVVKNFQLSSFSGSHGIGHTRMATESLVTTEGSHPYSTAEDECLVHNGSLSNHNNIRRILIKEGGKFKSDNDTEVAAGYISNKIFKGNDLETTLKDSLKYLDGFYTFIAGNKDGIALLRDEIACKPAVVAENEDYVAIASEFQAMAHLPDINEAKIFEPEPGIVYSWGN
jgi:glutamate synthase domain-containing protein 1